MSWRTIGGMCGVIYADLWGWCRDDEEAYIGKRIARRNCKSEKIIEDTLAPTHGHTYQLPATYDLHQSEGPFQLLPPGKRLTAQFAEVSGASYFVVRLRSVAKACMVNLRRMSRSRSYR